MIALGSLLFGDRLSVLDDLHLRLLFLGFGWQDKGLLLEQLLWF